MTRPRHSLLSTSLSHLTAPLLATTLLALVPACGPKTPPPPPPPAMQSAIDKGDALAIADALEALIDDGKDTEQLRQEAYDLVKAKEQPTAEYAFARAAVTGRLAQTKGLAATLLIGEAEEWGLKSQELDPTFRDGAATRLLGTLYVLAPGTFLKKGDSETGLEMLEKLTKEHPDNPENHLRYAEGLIALGDSGPAAEPLCAALAQKAKLRKDSQRLLEKLFKDAGSPTCPAPP